MYFSLNVFFLRFMIFDTNAFDDLKYNNKIQKFTTWEKSIYCNKKLAVNMKCRKKFKISSRQVYYKCLSLTVLEIAEIPKLPKSMFDK